MYILITLELNLELAFYPLSTWAWVGLLAVPLPIPAKGLEKAAEMAQLFGPLSPICESWMKLLALTWSSADPVAS